MLRLRVVAAFLGCALSLTAASDDSEFFESKIRPLLAANCHSCHTNGALGGLRLDSREAILKGGKSGPAVVTGKADESLLIQAVRRTHIRIKMPPVGPLSPAEVESMVDWVNRGLPWPEKQEQEQVQATATVITPAQRAFWSFQPVKKIAPLKVKEEAWVRTPVDRFVLAKLEEKGLQHAGSASKRAWLRRVTLDLIGLPPTPEDADAFEADHSAKAKEKVIDRLLSSPHYGERWGRHWLDLARYSDGQLAADKDTPLPNAWRYRDWVVNAFNNDLRYDTFVKAQIAADLLPETKDHLPGLGFQALGAGSNDQVDVNTKVFLGLTVGCAQCHDHKFDPIPTKDYYSLLGIFESTKMDEHPLVSKEAVEKYKTQKKKVDDLKEILNDYLAEQTKQLTDLLARARQYAEVQDNRGVRKQLGAGPQ